MGGRFFGGGAGGGDRRLRPHLNQNHQALKCPRCDSLNTKFCYYNNYNLSQPRHFCKSCRRYWTKGGVLRNVPVGGGCRKTKRSKHPKSSSSSTPSSSPASPPPPPQPKMDRRASSNSSTASESSSLTAAATTTAATEAVSAPTSTSSNLLNVDVDSRFFFPQSGGGGVEATASGIGMFSEIGSFTSLITASNDVPFCFTNMNDIPASPFRLNNSQHPSQQGQHEQSQWDQNEELKLAEINGGMLDQTAQVDLSVFQNRTNVGGDGGGGVFGSLDWQPSGDQGMFDLHNSVDQAYWSQGQWTDQDSPSLYIP